MPNPTVQKMLDSFDDLTLVQKTYTLSSQQEEQILNMIKGIKHYKQYMDVTGGIFETKRITPASEYAPNPNPLQLRKEALHSSKTAQFSLSEKEVQAFIQNGVLGPFDVISPQKAASLYDQTYDMYENEFEENFLLGDKFKQQLKDSNNWTLNYAAAWQALNCKEYRELLCRPEITDRLSSLLGDDIMCWRSQVFEIKPDQAGTFWHQASAFKETSKAEKLKFPTDIDPRMGQLTAWIALQDVDETNACLQFIPGSQAHECCEKFIYEYMDNIVYFMKDKTDEEIYINLKTLLFAPNIFHKAYCILKEAVNYLDWLFDGFKVKAYPMKAGQAIIFSSTVCHASYGNNSTSSRLAIAGRYTTPDVKVYDGFSSDHLSTQAGNLEFPIDKLASFMVCGTDKFHHNKISTF
ncbi:MAG TPA: hypothetical protein EYG01_01655 [Flavobacteriales bacterium]|nr:hypothetical protein [Flavobacteriales bacterium]